MLAVPLLIASAMVSSQGKGEIEQLIQWLPADTETLAVVREPIRVFDHPTVHRLTVSSWIAGVSDTKFKKLFELPAKFVVHGARKFQYPRNIGLGLFEGATIASLGSNEVATATKFLKQSKLKSKLVDGHQVYSYRNSDQDSFPVTFQISVVEHNLVVATNIDYLKIIFMRVKAKATDRALPLSLEEWKYVDQTSSFYAVRHINPKTQLVGMGMDFHDRQITGVSVSFKEGSWLKIVSLSDNPKGFEIAKSVWNDYERKTKVTSVAANASEIFVENEPKQSTMGLFYMFIALGYPIAV